MTLLPEAVVDALKRYLDQVREQHERACLEGYGGVELPYALARKYPDIRTVQELLGHKDIRTTQIYTHVLKLNGYAVVSPADKLWASALRRRDSSNTDRPTNPATALGQSFSASRWSDDDPLDLSQLDRVVRSYSFVVRGDS